MVWRNVFQAILALGLIAFATPFMPSSIFIQLRDIDVAGDTAILVRTVTIPTDALVTYEIGTDDATYTECNFPPDDRGRTIHFEDRGEKPLAFKLVCNPVPGELVIRYCVSAIGWFDIKLAPTCIEKDFWSGPRPEKMLQQQVDELKRELDALEYEVQNK